MSSELDQPSARRTENGGDGLGGRPRPPMSHVTSNAMAGPTPAVGQHPILSEEDQRHLTDFDHLRDLLRERTRSVAYGYHTGCYVVGRPGSSKTYTVEEELKRAGVTHVVKNAKMTAPGLVKLLQDRPEGVVVLDDIPSMLTERPAQQILLAALGGTAGRPRTISYTTAESDGRRAFEYSGGIIAISNVPLRHDPLANAVQSRVPLLEHEPTDEMLAAFMRFRAIQGPDDLMAEEALAVADFVIEESRACEYRLDLRSLDKAWADYRFCRDGRGTCRWQELVRSSLKKTSATSSTGPVTRRDTKDHHLRVAKELLDRYPGPNDKEARDREWADRTQRSPDTLYREWRKLKGSSTA